MAGLFLAPTRRNEHSRAIWIPKPKAALARAEDGWARSAFINSAVRLEPHADCGVSYDDGTVLHEGCLFDAGLIVALHYRTVYEVRSTELPYGYSAVLCCITRQLARRTSEQLQSRDESGDAGAQCQCQCRCHGCDAREVVLRRRRQPVGGIAVVVTGGDETNWTDDVTSAQGSSHAQKINSTRSTRPVCQLLLLLLCSCLVSRCACWARDGTQMLCHETWATGRIDQCSDSRRGKHHGHGPSGVLPSVSLAGQAAAAASDQQRRVLARRSVCSAAPGHAGESWSEPGLECSPKARHEHCFTAPPAC